MGEWNDLLNQTSCKNCTGGRTNENIGADECSKYMDLSHYFRIFNVSELIVLLFI